MKNRTVLWGPLAGLLFLFCIETALAQETDETSVAPAEEAAPADPDALGLEEADSAATAAARATIDAFNSAIVEAIQADEASGFLGRLEIISPAVWEAFDMQLLARRTIGRLKWRRWSDEQKTSYVDTLQLLQSATLADRFKHGSDVSFAIDDVSDGRKGTKRVHTRIVRTDDEDVKLDYLLLEREEKWRVVDVYLNSTISEVSTRRADYSNILRDEGFDALIAALNKQIDDLFERNGEVRDRPDAVEE